MDRMFLGGMLLGLLLFFFSVYYHNYKDLFHPICFFSILSILRYVPSTFSGDVDNFVELTDAGIFKFVIMTSITIFCVVIGYEVQNRHSKRNYGLIISGRINRYMFSYGLLIFIIGVASRVYFIQKTGGLTYILSNIRDKLNMVTGQGYLLAVGNLMTYGIVLMLCSEYKKEKCRHSFLMNAFIIACIAVDLFLFAFMSDRTAPMRSLMIIVMAYHYNYERIKISSLLHPKYLSLIIMCIIFIVAMPLLRNAQGYDAYGSIENLISSAMDGVKDVLYWFSYMGRDVFIFQHFNPENYWLGLNILNFLTSPIPSGLLGGHKLPVDEGYYLSNLIMGYESAPPDYTWVYNSSIPFDNQGIMYANFGIIGLIAGGLLMGIVYSMIYKIMCNNDYHPVTVVISQVILYNFSLTSHDMVNVLLLIGFLLLPFFLTGSLRFEKKYINVHQ